jgi:quinol monooxygenase YgiN
MAAMNIVHMRIKPGKESEYLALHEALRAQPMAGMRNFWIVKTGERDFCIVGEWDSMTALAGSRSAMVANLDKLRPLLEDLGGGRGVTEPWSGEVALHMGERH